MKKGYVFLPRLFDVTTPCINPEYMEIGIEIGNTIYRVSLPKSDSINILTISDENKT